MIRDEALVEELPEIGAAPGAAVASKSILLFSDGTGNSSAKLFKTNIWRLYEAVDLGPAPPGQQVQIAYYDNGVGTSGFRPLALLGGIFGWGLKRNVLRLYTFLCRNYTPGDKIYAFGFSRGAFTIRVLVALVARQGILVDQKDSDLAYLAHDAYRAICQDNWPRRWPRAAAQAVRWVRERLIGLKRKFRGPSITYEAANRTYEDVEFVGVWDTVAAYGGPFAEFTRGIDDWVWPLSMPNYGLSVRIRRARHVLSLDDERDSFHPLLWDEHVEHEQVRKGGTCYFRNKDGSIGTRTVKVDRHRLRQVWFAGVHSDVGGGYPDESLSYTSLVWMMDELGPDVRFIPEFAGRARGLANALGPIHNSRSGLAAYYRYQPRKIAAWLDPPRRETVSMRDPQVRGKDGRPHGLLKRVLVHESVLARIASGVDNYAPAALPAHFIPILATGPYARSSLSLDRLRDLTRTNIERKRRFAQQENEWDDVWTRRTIYFLTVLATLLLLILPQVPWFAWLDDMCADDRCFAYNISETLLFFLPGSFRDWLVPWVMRPIGTLALLLIILSLIWWGRGTERKFRDRVRDTWTDFRLKRFASRKTVKPTPLRRFRESDRYQFALFDLKWRFLPFLFGIASLLALLFAGTIVASQMLYAVAEPHAFFCKEGEAPPAKFDIAQSCTDLGFEVQRGQQYRLVMTPKLPWNDGWTRILGIDVDEIEARPNGGVSEETMLMKLARPLKRVTNARWLQPVTEVRAPHTGRLAKWQWLVGKDVELREVHFAEQGKGTYLSEELCPRRSGRLHLMVNDAAPWLSKAFYGNNGGTAAVTVIPTGRTCVPFSERPPVER